MCIYCGTDKYRRIYKNHYGPIPKDVDGRTYEVHHIDGNHDNNDPNNLVAISIQEHYAIHESQQEYGACVLIAERLELSPEEKSALSTAYNNQRVENGTHPWVGGEHQIKLARQRIEAGTWHFTSEFAKTVQRELINNGTHHLLGGEVQRKTVRDGTHNMLGGEIQRKRVQNGTHHLLGTKHIDDMLANGTHASQIKKTCHYCNKTVSSNTYARWHGNNCRKKGN
jgi:hypothetical protein